MSIRDDKTGLFGRVMGFLSDYAEWHALAVGALFGVLSGFTLSTPLMAFLGLVVLGKAGKSNEHLSDAAKEVAYTAGGFVPMFVLGFVARGFA